MHDPPIYPRQVACLFAHCIYYTVSTQCFANHVTDANKLHFAQQGISKALSRDAFTILLGGLASHANPYEGPCAIPSQQS